MRTIWSAPAGHGSTQLADFAQQGGQVGESPSGDGAGVELEFELGQSAAILASSSASRASSFAICSSSLSNCRSLCSCAILRFSNAIVLCSSLYCSTFLSIVGCQFSHSFAEDFVYASSRRQSGKEARNACLVRSWEGRGDSREDDMVVSGQQGDQCQQKHCYQGDPALSIQSDHHQCPARGEAAQQETDSYGRTGAGIRDFTG